MSKFLEIAKDYDAFLLDLWGVVHDGTSLYEGVHEALEKLHGMGKKIIFLSNAPRRASRVMAVLKGLGIEAGIYDTAMSSGEAGFLWLQSGACTWGKRYYYIGPEKDLNVLDGLDHQKVESLDDADYLLNVGFGSDDQSEEDFAPLLKDAKARGLPMLCLNPDMEVVKITGERFPCAGVIGKAYAAIGGEVVWFGKPYQEVYDLCFAMMPGIAKSKILAVGDSVETDIRGGVRAGIDTMLIMGGILKKHTNEQMEALFAEHEAKPRYTLPRLAA